MSQNQSAYASDLGKQVADYRAKDDSNMAIVFGVFGLFCAGTGLLATFGGGDSFVALGQFIACVGGLIVIAMVIYYIRARGQGMPAVSMFEHGLVVGRKSEPPAVVRWKDISEYRVKVLQKFFITPISISMRGDYTFHFTKKDGATVEIHNRFIPNRQLAATLWTVIADMFIPTAITEFQDGRTLTFGPLRLNSKRIEKLGGDSLNWDQVERIEISGGYITVMTRSERGRFKWANVRAEDVPNLPVFAALISGPKVNKLAGQITLPRTTFGL